MGEAVEMPGYSHWGVGYRKFLVVFGCFLL